MHDWSGAVIIALAWSLAPVFAFGFATSKLTALIAKLPQLVRVLLPSIFAIPYVLVAYRYSILQWTWLGLYFALPVVVALVLEAAKRFDPEQRGSLQDLAVLFGLGLAVDLRWLEPAWPPHLSVISKLIMLDSGLYGFIILRQLSDVGFDLRPRGDDLKIGFRELLFYAPIAIPLGLVLGFLHTHGTVPRPGGAVLAWVFTFIVIALPEEIYFRGWIQNLLERRIGRNSALWLTAAIFGLSHFNKRAAHFNWRYVLLATLAGIFYGRAWRQQHRVLASSLTHAFVDTIWSIWLR